VLCESRGGDLWIGTYGRGLMRFENGHLVTLSAPVSLPHNNILAVFEDAEENVWVGTQGACFACNRAPRTPSRRPMVRR
jgi:ligand-binding sensor domain-containing protein